MSRDGQVCTEVKKLEKQKELLVAKKNNFLFFNEMKKAEKLARKIYSLDEKIIKNRKTEIAELKVFDSLEEIYSDERNISLQLNIIIDLVKKIANDKNNELNELARKIL